ncbi:hypothetical protein B0H11DRAFT_2352637 [Mycena galericulata]|nr:hypothetical protein B0H11DRAFT_2352637 [Mycena galericulata]
MASPPFLASISHNLPDGEPLHTHEHCSHCLQTQRSHAAKLALCKSCGIDRYCSKECQKAHWPNHKAGCKAAKELRLDIAQRSGIELAMPDFHAWLGYYDTPLKNCAIASMRLTEDPHRERKPIFHVQLLHKGSSTLPVWDRFEVMGIQLRTPAEMPPDSMFRPEMRAEYEQSCARGRVEMGNRFYGVVRLDFFVMFSPTALTEEMKYFSIDIATARARIVRQDWWMLLREYVAVGAKMKFCCGQFSGPGLDDICCCGGWVHDAERLKAFSDIKVGQ